VPIVHLKSSLKPAVLERVALTTGLITFFIVGYFSVPLTQDPAGGRELISSLDQRIPFVAGSVWVYLWVFPATFIPLFVVRCPQLFRRTALAYTVVIAASIICFAAFPVTSVQLRAAPAMLDLTNCSDWVVSILYALDPPYNLFPSLHLAMATVSAFSLWKAARMYGAAAFAGVGLVSVSVCTVKQHFVVDALAGLALAALASAAILGPYHPDRGIPLTYSWRGPMMYLVIVVVSVCVYRSSEGIPFHLPAQ
jgi:membrane-associated phospholipid phosphatase